MKIGRNLLVLCYFSMRSRVPTGRRAAAAETGHPRGSPSTAGGRWEGTEESVSKRLHCSQISIWGGGVQGRPSYPCRCECGGIIFSYTSPTLQRPRYREKTEKPIIHDLPLGESLRVAL